MFRALLPFVLIIFFLQEGKAVTSTYDIAHPFYLLPEGHYSILATGGHFMEEFEYEKASVVQDLFEYEHRFYKLGTMIGLSPKRQVGFDLTFLEGGKLSKRYSPALNLAPENISYRGFHAIELTYQEHLRTKDSKDKMAVEIKLKGSPLKGKDTNNTYQGKDIAINFHYSHLHADEWRIYGTIHSQVIGKKKNLKHGNETEIVSPYSEFGTLLGVQWLKSSFWIDLNGLFYLTTDYNSTSPSYTRLTDKGFVVGGKLALGYYLAPTAIMSISHTRQGSNFNMITESTSEANEFEIETQSTQLGVTWLF